MTIALLDSDIFVYRIGFTTEDVSEDIARWRLRELIEGILSALKTDTYKAFITSTDKSNFRYGIAKDYKANRKQPKPLHYDFLRNVLKEEWNAEEVFGMEADDAIGIAQNTETCIVTIDKDLNQIPGQHFNFVKGILYDIGRDEGERFFYKQILTGDRIDNIEGIRGIGDSRAEVILNGGRDPTVYWGNILEAYAAKVYEGSIEKAHDHAKRNGQLLRIRQASDEGLWMPPDTRRGS